MATQTKFPTAYSMVGPWVNPTNIYADDSAWTDVSGERKTNRTMIGSGFGFSIPAGSTINGISVNLKYYVGNTNGDHIATLALRLNGTVLGTIETKTNYSPLTDVVWTKSTLNGSPTISEINASTLEAYFNAYQTGYYTQGFHLNCFYITVDYTPPSPKGRYAQII